MLKAKSARKLMLTVKSAGKHATGANNSLCIFSRISQPVTSVCFRSDWLGFCIPTFDWFHIMPIERKCHSILLLVLLLFLFL